MFDLPFSSFSIIESFLLKGWAYILKTDFGP